MCSCLLQISKQQLQTVKERFQAFLNGETQIVADEAFINAVQSYYDVSLNDLFYGYFTLPLAYSHVFIHVVFFYVLVFEMPSIMPYVCI